eukprot:jgi/Chrzof1/10394/Cz04g40100.t1
MVVSSCTAVCHRHVGVAGAGRRQPARGTAIARSAVLQTARTPSTYHSSYVSSGSRVRYVTAAAGGSDPSDVRNDNVAEPQAGDNPEERGARLSSSAKTSSNAPQGGDLEAGDNPQARESSGQAADMRDQHPEEQSQVRSMRPEGTERSNDDQDNVMPANPS